MSRVQFALGAARQYVEKLFGGPCAEIEGSFATGVNSVVVAQGNGDRVGLVFINTGVNTVGLGFTNGGVVTNAIQLSAFGGSISMSVIEDFTLTTREWRANSALGGSAVYVLEVVRVSLNEAGGS